MANTMADSTSDLGECMFAAIKSIGYIKIYTLKLLLTILLAVGLSGQVVAQQNIHTALGDLNLLQQLHDNGALTDQEYEKIKREILSFIDGSSSNYQNSSSRAEEIVEKWFADAFKYADLSAKERREIRSMISYVADEKNGIPIIRDVVAGKLGKAWVEIDEIVIKKFEVIEQDIEFKNIKLHLNPLMAAELKEETGVSIEKIYANLSIQSQCANNICSSTVLVDFPELFAIKGSSKVGGERVLRAMLNNPEYAQDDAALAAVMVSLNLHNINYVFKDQGVIDLVFQLLEKKQMLTHEMLQDRARVILYKLSEIESAKDIPGINGDKKDEIEQVLLKNIYIARDAISWLFGKPDQISISVIPEEPMSILAMGLQVMAEEGATIDKWINIEFIGLPKHMSSSSPLGDLSNVVTRRELKNWRDFYTTVPYDLKTKAKRRGEELYSIYCSQCHGAKGHGVDGKGISLVGSGASEVFEYQPIRSGMRHSDISNNELLNHINGLIEEGEKIAVSMHIHALWEDKHYPDEAVSMMQQGMTLIQEKGAVEEAIKMLKMSARLGYPAAEKNLSAIYKELSSEN